VAAVFSDSRYSPFAGRFILPDPIFFESEEINTFLYAGGAPISHLDPLGNKKIPASTGASDPIVRCQKKVVNQGIKQAFGISLALSNASSAMLASCGAAGPAAPICVKGVGIIMGATGAAAIGSCVASKAQEFFQCENILK